MWGGGAVTLFAGNQHTEINIFVLNNVANFPLTVDNTQITMSARVTD